MPNPYLYAVVALTIVLIVIGLALGMMVLNEAAMVGSLQAEVDTLKANYAILQTKYEELSSKYMSLLSNYTTLQIQCQGISVTAATLQVQAVGLTSVNSGRSATLTLLVSNPSSSGIGINGFTLGSLSCVLSTPLQIPAGTQGAMITITLPESSSGSFAMTGVSVNGIAATCSGTQTAQVGIQYSGYITTVSGQTYPFTVTASS